MEVEIVEPSGVIWKGEARSVTAPSVDGEVGILAGHTPLMAVLQDGIVRVHTSDDEHRFAITSGFMTVESDHISVVARGATAADEAASADLADVDAVTMPSAERLAERSAA
ncbi:MAG: F0F1 ATP synthase subunit epsilon [Actinomycetaceae bacterium]|nr:F0F1 ATP synthase subunit epsilon [Actinomycetaceae bacterium]MDY6082771.1 F0F1 ATP synthase subunit epsilon [Actinomycetaceae bacterium]